MKQEDDIFDSNIIKYLMELEPDVESVFNSFIRQSDENIFEQSLCEKRVEMKKKSNNIVENSYINEETINLNLRKRLKRKLKSDYTEDDCSSDYIADFDEDDEDDDAAFEEEEDDENLSINTRRRSKLIKQIKYTNSDSGNKKESNKEAATRYRIKKLNEKDRLFETKVHLEKQNDEVKKKIDLIQTEISYLKYLLVQMLLTKGIMNNNLTS